MLARVLALDSLAFQNRNNSPDSVCKEKCGRVRPPLRGDVINTEQFRLWRYFSGLENDVGFEVLQSKVRFLAVIYSQQKTRPAYNF